MYSLFSRVQARNAGCLVVFLAEMPKTGFGDNRDFCSGVPPDLPAEIV